MKKLLFFILFPVGVFAQSQLSIYPNPPTGDGIDRHNEDYTVQARMPNGIWQNLYEYKTYVNITQNRFNYEESSFVTFDFEGVVEIKITSNWTEINNVLIRPQSQGIVFSQSGNTVQFSISSVNAPVQLSFEINGNRYRNLQIFANPMVEEPPASIITKRFEAGVLYEFPDHKYIAQDNDVIYFEPGAVIKGGIYVVDKSNVKIIGRGIIDLSFLRKQYHHPTLWNPPYEYIQGITVRRSNNVEMEGVIINDPQAFCVGIVDSDSLTINNLKMFSRVIWGDGIDIVGTNNVVIDNCFMRTADDCIAIYASRVRSWPWQNRNTTNISVKKTILYADAAHPIEIGWNGNRGIDGTGGATDVEGNVIYKLRFENIDILEHEEPLVEYMGAISINCAEKNRCVNFKFKNIRVEDFSHGRLLTIKVEEGGYGGGATDGKYVEDISFTNFSYDGYGENTSIIAGINCEKYVNGVHFQNFTVNGQLVLEPSDYNFSINDYAYNITFQDANNFSTTITDGRYKIRNKQTGKYLYNSMQVSGASSQHVITFPFNSSYSQVWDVTNIPGTGHYRIQNPQSGNYLSDSDILYVNDCKGRYSLASPYAESTQQEWRIVPEPNGYVTIQNAHTRAYIHNSNQDYPPDTNGDYAITYPENDYINQKWQLIKVDNKENIFNRNSTGSVQIYPNPSDGQLYIAFDKKQNSKLILLDFEGNIVLQTKLYDPHSSHDLSSLKKGWYFVKIMSNEKIIHMEKLIIR